MTTAHIPAAKIDSTTAPNRTRKSRWASGRMIRQRSRATAGSAGRLCAESGSPRPVAASVIRGPSGDRRGRGCRGPRGRPSARRRSARARRSASAHSPSNARAKSGASSRTSRICRAYSSQSVASRSIPPSRTAPAAIVANSGVSRRRFVCLFLCQGRGRTPTAPRRMPRAADAGALRVRSPPRVGGCARRRDRRRASCGRARRVNTSMARKSTSGRERGGVRRSRDLALSRSRR